VDRGLIRPRAPYFKRPHYPERECVVGESAQASEARLWAAHFGDRTGPEPRKGSLQLRWVTAAEYVRGAGRPGSPLVGSDHIGTARPRELVQMTASNVRISRAAQARQMVWL
jgi:hypothetical protein